MRQRFLIPLQLLAVMAILIFPGTVLGAGSPAFSLSLNNAGPAVDGTVQVTVSGSNLSDVYGYELNLEFDPAKMEYVTYKDDSSGWTSVPMADDGKVTLVHTLTGENPGKNGDLTLAVITFKAKASGEAVFTLGKVKLVDSTLKSSVVTPAKTATAFVASGSSGNNDGGGGSTGTSSTANPEETLTATIDKVTKDSAGNWSIIVSNKVTAIILPTQLEGLLQTPSITIGNEQVTLVIPAEVLKQIRNHASAEQWTKGQIIIHMNPVSAVQAAQLIEQGKDVLGASVSQASEMYDFALSFSAGTETMIIDHFAEPVTVMFSVPDAADPELISVFHMTGNGMFELIRGTYSNKKISGSLQHFSLYGVLEVRKQFTDVPATHWAYETITKLAAKQIVNGTSPTAFAPAQSVTRAEFTALLVRALGLTAGGTASFQDVAAEDWFYPEVAAAAEAGIVQGKNNNVFEPDSLITREEMVVMMMRAYSLKSGGVSTVLSGSFSDESEIALWALEYVTKAKGLNLVQGRSAGMFEPKGIASRAEAAQLIYNLLKQL